MNSTINDKTWFCFFFKFTTFGTVLRLILPQRRGKGSIFIINNRRASWTKQPLLTKQWWWLTKVSFQGEERSGFIFSRNLRQRKKYKEEERRISSTNQQPAFTISDSRREKKTRKRDARFEQLFDRSFVKNFVISLVPEERELRSYFPVQLTEEIKKNSNRNKSENQEGQSGHGLHERAIPITPLSGVAELDLKTSGPSTMEAPTSLNPTLKKWIKRKKNTHNPRYSYRPLSMPLISTEVSKIVKWKSRNLLNSTRKVLEIQGNTQKITVSSAKTNRKKPCKLARNKTEAPRNERDTIFARKTNLKTVDAHLCQQRLNRAECAKIVVFVL